MVNYQINGCLIARNPASPRGVFLLTLDSEGLVDSEINCDINAGDDIGRGNFRNNVLIPLRYGDSRELKLFTFYEDIADVCKTV